MFDRGVGESGTELSGPICEEEIILVSIVVIKGLKEDSCSEFN